MSIYIYICIYIYVYMHIYLHRQIYMLVHQATNLAHACADLMSCCSIPVFSLSVC